MADIGAGTGILTKEFIGRVKQIYAIEPNREMVFHAKETLDGVKGSSSITTYDLISARAEALPLSDDSVDLVTVAQAVHWFEPQTARDEFRRILKPRGRLALIRNYGTDQALGEAMEGIYPPECDTMASMVGRREPRHFYFEDGEYFKQTFPIQSQLSWENFIGAITTASYAPDNGTMAYTLFEKAARRVFNNFQVGNRVTIQGITELYLGQITY